MILIEEVNVMNNFLTRKQPLFWDFKQQQNNFFFEQPTTKEYKTPLLCLLKKTKPMGT